MSGGSTAFGKIKEAVILMAGSGSRLRLLDDNLLKPLIPLQGRPLISYTIESLAAVGVEKITAVIGFHADRLRAGMRALVPAKIDLRFVENREWQRPNGISLLAASGSVTGPFMLTMGDHLFAQEIFHSLSSTADPKLLNVAIDKKIESIFDLDDAMKVQTSGGEVIKIGKQLETYNAIDIGAFVCPRNIFDQVKQINEEDDSSLAAAVQLMASRKKARAIDIGDAWWHDVDTPQMLRNAESDLGTRFRRRTTDVRS